MTFGKAATNRRTATISLRAFASQRELIDRACRETNKNMTDFILEAACREAEHVLCDRRYFVLSENDFDAFEAALNTPLSENRALQRLLVGKSPWEE